MFCAKIFRIVNFLSALNTLLSADNNRNQVILKNLGNHFLHIKMLYQSYISHQVKIQFVANKVTKRMSSHTKTIRFKAKNFLEVQHSTKSIA